MKDGAGVTAMKEWLTKNVGLGRKDRKVENGQLNCLVILFGE
jgi:hypothetical protein